MSDLGNTVTHTTKLHRRVRWKPWTGVAFLGGRFFGFLAAFFGLAMKVSRVLDADGIVAAAEAKEKGGNAPPRFALLRRLFAPPPPSAKVAEAGEAGAE